MASPSLELVELINLVHGNICHGNSDILEIGLRRSLIECATRSSKPNTSRLLSLKAAQELYFFFIWEPFKFCLSRTIQKVDAQITAMFQKTDIALYKPVCQRVTARL